MAQAEILRVVVASPGDVQSERKAVQAVADELNKGIGKHFDLRLEVCRWETEAHPGFHLEGPQGLIDSILRIEECDILICVFWKRFGTPVTDAKSGTEHEFKKAYEAWKAKGKPQIMVYFNQKPYTLKSPEEVYQCGQVVEFKTNFPAEGLSWPYDGKNNFEKLVREHMNDFVSERLKTSLIRAGAAAALGSSQVTDAEAKDRGRDA